MDHQQKAALFVAACIALMIGVVGIEGTVYISPNPCDAFWRAGAVFVGTVQKQNIRTFADKVVARERERALPQNVLFDVKERLHGDLQQTVEVENRTWSKWGEGETLLVYATLDPSTGRLYAGIPSRTAPIADATQELQQLRRFAKTRKTERVVVGRAQDPTGAGHPVSDLPLTLSCDRRAYSTTSNSSGAFEFRVEQPARSCQLRPALTDSQYLDFVSDVVFTEPRTCAEAYVAIRDNGRIAGQVLSAASAPMVAVTVDVWRAPRTPDRPQGAAASLQTDPNGRFEAAHLAPGSYVVAINSRTDISKRFSFGLPAYFPGVGDPEAAAAISVGKGQRVELNQPFVLPPETRFAGVDGTVVLEDGREAGGAIVRVMTGLIARPGNSLQIAELTADSSGRFSGRFPVGASYWLDASWPPFAELAQNQERFQFEETGDLTVEPSGVTLRISLHRPLKP